MDKIVLRAKKSSIEQGIDKIKSTLASQKVPSKEITKVLLTCEEVLACLIDACGDEEEKIYIFFIKSFGKVRVSMCCHGKEKINIDDVKNSVYTNDEGIDVESKLVIKKLIGKIINDNVSVENNEGMNYGHVFAKKEKMSSLVKTLIALALALLIGSVVKMFVPSSILSAVSENVISPIYSMFLSAIKMLVAPLVFFSIAASISEYDDLKVLGKLALKVVCFYIVTSIFALAVGYLTYQLFPIGDSSMLSLISNSDVKGFDSTGFSISIKDFIVGIIPSDSISAFLKSQMLQVIFMGVLLGIGVSKLSKKNTIIKKFVSESSIVLEKIMEMVISFMPLAVFCTITALIIRTDIMNVLKIAKLIPVCWFAHICMLVIYSLILLIVGRINPFRFYKRYSPVMLAGFMFASSSPTMPVALETCDKRMGIDKKIYSFSIPLGTTINMDGFCTTLVIESLYLSKIYGLEITTSVLISIFASVLILSIGCPGVGGAVIVCLSLVLMQINIPVESLVLIIALEPIINTLQTCVNVTGDGVITTIIAKRQKMIDMKKFGAR